MNQAEKTQEGVLVFTAQIPERQLADQDVPLLLQWKNIGKENIVIYGRVSESVTVDIKTSGGKDVTPTLFGRRLLDRQKSGGLSGGPVRILNPAQKATVTLNLAQLFDLTLAERYLIKVSTNIKSPGGKAGILTIESLDFELQEISLPLIQIQRK